MTRLVVFSAVRLFGDALTACLAIQKEISAVTCCSSANRLLEEVAAFGPDAVLFDITGENALQDAYALNVAIPELPLLALAVPETPQHVIACVDAGFRGYVPRQASVPELCTIVEMVVRGECACHPRIAGSLVRELGRRRQQCSQSPPFGTLTRRETEILRFLARGQSNKEIARELCLSLATVKNHVHSILQKLKVDRRTEAVSRLRDEPWLALSA